MRIKWFFIVIFLIHLGLADSIYLAYHHYEINILEPDTKSFCAINETIDCDKAATSIGSTFWGGPGGHLGDVCLFIYHVFRSGGTAFILGNSKKPCIVLFISLYI